MCAGIVIAAMLRRPGAVGPRTGSLIDTELRHAGGVGMSTGAVVAMELRGTGAVGVRNAAVISTMLGVTCGRACRSWWDAISASCARSGCLGCIAARVHDRVGHRPLGARSGIRR